ERYLADEPVEACPPSAGYKLKKFARRYRKVLASVAAFAALLVAGAVVSTSLAVRATSAEKLSRERLAEVQRANAQTEQALQESEQARQQAETVSQFLVDSFRKPDPEQDGRTLTVAALFEQAEKPLQGDSDLPLATRATLLDALG